MPERGAAAGPEQRQHAGDADVRGDHGRSTGLSALQHPSGAHLHGRCR